MKILKSLVSGVAWFTGAALLLTFFATVIMVVGLINKGFEMQDEENEPAKTDRAVAVVDLSGEIFSSDKFRKALMKQVEDEKIKAIVVQIDSPGGAVGAAEEMYRAIISANKKKPVVCIMGSVAASGGLYAAMGCPKIVTHSGTISGSIGVILMSPNFSTVMERLGVGMNIVKSGQFKDAGSPFRASTEEEKALLQSLVNQAYEQFVNVIAKSRKLDPEKVKSFADGRVILGESLVKLGVADLEGGIEEAAQEALTLAGVSGVPELVYPKEHEGLISLITGMGESSFIGRVLANDRGSMQLLYR